MFPSMLQKDSSDECALSKHKRKPLSCHRKSVLIDQIPAIQGSFVIKRRLGKGAFGEVFLASLKKNPDCLYALKYIFPISTTNRIKNEIKCLSLLKGCDNVVSLETFIHYENHVVLIMPFIEHDKFNEYVSKINLCEVRDYMKSLFVSLASIHEIGIIHRDIKPSNCLYNCSKREFKLIDFGLAEIRSKLEMTSKNYGVPNLNQCKNNSRRYGECKHTLAEVCSICLCRPTQKTPRNGTPGFRAPEILLKYPNQTAAIDVWSAGVIFLCFLSGKYPFFKASNDLFALIETITLFGSERCINVAKLLHKEITCFPSCHPQNLTKICKHLRSILHKVDSNKLHAKSQNCTVIFEPTSETSYPPSESTCRDTSQSFASAVAYDLLERCLDVNPFTRITSSQAIQHPFFR